MAAWARKAPSMMPRKAQTPEFTEGPDAAAAFEDTMARIFDAGKPDDDRPPRPTPARARKAQPKRKGRRPKASTPSKDR